MNRSIIALCLVCAAVPRIARADGNPLAEVESLESFALENFDLGDYAAARDKLVEALARLDTAGLAQKPQAARPHALLAMVYVMGFADPAKAEQHMVRAVELDGAVALDSRASADVKALFDKAQAQVNPVIDCATLEGIAHKRVLSTEEGKPTEITAKVGVILQAGPVALRYRGTGMGDFAELPMEKQADCDYHVVLPAKLVKPSSVLYFIVAKTSAGRIAASQGSEARPYRLEVTSTKPSQASQQEIKRQEDEVPVALQAGKGKGGGCAGCETSAGTGLGAPVLALAVAFRLRRRRRT